jgi:hypothetical protein
MSGSQFAGCCVHIATVIYYLSYAKSHILKDPKLIKLPASHFNKILVNTKSFEKPNAPRYVRNKRRSKEYILKDIEYQSPSVSSSEISSDDEPYGNVKKKFQNINFHKIETEAKKGEAQVDTQIQTCSLFVNDVIPTFIDHIPFWGGYFIINKKKLLLSTHVLLITIYLRYGSLKNYRPILK